MSVPPPPLHPPDRLLCGPGPSNVCAAAMEAMRRPMLGHLDPDFHDILLETSELLAAVYQARDGLALALSATGTSGMEAGLCNLLEPEDEVIVAVNGFFGARIAEISRRHGAEVIEVHAPLGRSVPNADLLEALERHPRARMLAVVHAETSTGVQHRLDELAQALRGSDVLLMADCVTSLGGVSLDVTGWSVDYAYACTQKCVSAPPGMSPVFVSERALERIRDRRSPVPFSLDLLALERYWRERPAVYHHTAPVLSIYALHAALREIVAETLPARWARHAQAGEHLQALLTERGLELFADPDHQLAPLTAVCVPDGTDGRAVQRRLLSEHGIEIGGGLGPGAPPIWRIGLMGPNATVATARRVADALGAVLATEPALSGVA